MFGAKRKTTSNEQRLSTLFPAMQASTIQNTLDVTKGDTAKAILLLIQTPADSESIVPKHEYKYKEWMSDSKRKRAFIKQRFKQSKCNSFSYIISILFWICIAIILIITIILSSTEIIVDESFSMTMSFSSTIELIFTLLILYGIISYQIWCIWVTLIWSGLHGITAIYLLIKWHNNSSYMIYYICIVLVYWLSVFVFNLTYFIRLNRAESSFNYLIEETKIALNGKTNTTVNVEQNNNNILTPGKIESEIDNSNMMVKNNKNESNDNEHHKQDTNDINVDELVDLAMDVFDDIDSNKDTENDNQSNEGSVIIKENVIIE